MVEAIAIALCCVFSADPPAVDRRSIVGGAPAVREAVAALGRDAYYQWMDAEFWIEPEVVVVLLKAPWRCPVVLEHGLPATYWHDMLVIWDQELPREPTKRETIKRQRLFYAIEEPGGSSCAWRLLEPKTDWESYVVMEQSRTIGDCSMLVESLKKLHVGEATQKAVGESLRHPKSLSECWP